MIELGIIDLSADGRRRIASLIEKWTWVSPDSRVSLPQISLNLLSPEEIRFNGGIDVCVVGPELIGSDAAFLQTIRQQLPGKLILSILSQQIYSIGLLEQLSRLGVDDVLMDTASSDEFFRRIVLLQRRITHRRKGRLVIVSSARGGVGTTFVAAGIAEGYLSKSKKTCVVDCDLTSQDLTRFLQVRPHVSEPLRLLIDHQRIVTAETVGECAHVVWSDEPNIVCVPPAAGHDDSVFSGARAARAFVAILETLQTQHDVVIVDSASLPMLAVSALYQVADEVIFVANRDPSGAFAHRQALLHIAGYLRPSGILTTVINDNSLVAASVDLIRAEALSVPGRVVNEVMIPRSVKAGRWPCGGCTPYQFLTRSFDPLIDERVGEVPLSVSSSRGWIASVRSTARGFREAFRLRKGKSADPGSAESPTHRSFEFPELGCHDGVMEPGALVSKPVLLS